MDYEFYIQVDRTPPSVSIGSKIVVYNKEDKNDDDEIIVPAGTISAAIPYQASDTNLASWVIEWGEGEHPGKWIEYQSSSEGGEKSATILVDSEFAIGKTFRLTAVDHAGNIATRVTPLLEETILVNHWEVPYSYGWPLKTDDGHCWTTIELSYEDIFMMDDIVFKRPGEDFVSKTSIPELWAEPGLHLMRGIETIRYPIAEITVQHLVSGSTWVDDNTVYNPESGAIELEWNNTDIPDARKIQ